jgi:hypothetical protein
MADGGVGGGGRTPFINLLMLEMFKDNGYVVVRTLLSVAKCKDGLGN